MLGFVARPLRRIGVAGRGVRAAAVAGSEYAGGWTAGGGAASASLEPPGRSAKKERNRVGWERERERERERAMDRENVSGDARGLEADIKDWKAAGLVGGGWQCKHMYKIGSRQIWWQRRAYLLLATRLVQKRQPVV